MGCEINVGDKIRIKNSYLKQYQEYVSVWTKLPFYEGTAGFVEKILWGSVAVVNWLPFGLYKVCPALYVDAENLEKCN